MSGSAGAALRGLLAARARLVAVRRAGDALGLGPHELLHAGPPLQDPRRPPPVLQAAAAAVLVHEGRAAGTGAALALLAGGAVRLVPAQDRGCVVPLACVVGPGTPVFAVQAGTVRLHAPVPVVRGADHRMGWPDPAVGERLRLRDIRVAPGWARVLAATGPLDLAELAAIGLAAGDDLHVRTSAATDALAQAARHAGEHVLADDVEATPLFFLTPWMAACAALLRTAEGGDLPTLVTRAGGNGDHFGIALAGAPGHWFTTEAQPPHGHLDGRWPSQPVCGAIGDSAIVEAFGTGGMALAGAPQAAAAFAGHLPADHAQLAGRLLAAVHPLLGRPVGLDARRVVDAGCAPLVALAMLAADGQAGLVGRGLYRPPVDLFARALAGTGLAAPAGA